MSTVGWIGLGKLGLPCALAMEHQAAGALTVVGYDVAEPTINPYEDGLSELLAATRCERAATVADVVARTDRLIFVSVQTPHGPEYGGETPMPATTADFDYSYLRQVAADVAAAADEQAKGIIMVVISTALPGTMRREILPLLGEHVALVYNPFFIAMGTTINDFLNPEFVLIGADDPAARQRVHDFYTLLYPATVPLLTMGIEEAELTKVAYNTFISMKIVFANTMLEICDKMGIDVDTVTGALAHGTRRLMSPAYLRGGVGDGGACHPRDNIAMSWLAEQQGISTDIFGFVTRARELQSWWLAVRVVHEAIRTGLPVVVLGKAYKPESNLIFGSPAALLCHQLVTMGQTITAWWDPHVDGGELPAEHPALYVVMTRHAEFAHQPYPSGSVILDPHRYLESTTAATVIWLGRTK